MGSAENSHFQQVPVLWSLKPENKRFKEESQLSEYISISLVAFVQTKLSAVEVRLFLAKITLCYIEKKSFFIYSLMDIGSLTI